MVKLKDLSSHENGRKKSSMNLTQTVVTWVLKQTSFEILNKLFLSQLQDGNKVRLVCGWMDVLDYKRFYVIAAGITQGFGVNSLHGGWNCRDVHWSFQVHSTEASSKSSLGYSPWWLQLVTSSKAPDEPRPCCEKAPGEINLPKELEKKSRSTQTVHHSCYSCAPVAACKNHITYPRACAAWILSLQHCHRSLSSTLGS